MTNPFRRKTDPNEITQYIADIKEMMAMRDKTKNEQEYRQLTTNIHIANEVLTRLLERAG